MGAVAAGAALASGISGAASSVIGGAGTDAADEYKADRLQRAAEYGRLAADQTDAQMRDRLNVSLGNINAIRAAGHDDPTSPTGAAILDKTELLGDTARTIKVGNIIAQSEQDTADANYLNNAGSFAQTMGWMGGGTDLLKTVGNTDFNAFGLG